MLNSKTLLVATILLATASTLFAQSKLAIDGKFDDWKSNDAVIVDPEGDSEGAFDVVSASARLLGSRLFVKFQLAKPMNLQSGLKSDGNLRFHVCDDKGLGWNNTESIHISLRDRKALLIGQGVEKAITWKDIEFECLPTFASETFEFSLDVSPIQSELSNPKVMFRFAGSDGTESATVETSKPIKPNVNWNLDVPKEADFRIANLNTQRNGLADTKRGPKIKRLIEAANASIYCFQEEWEQAQFNEGFARTFGPGAYAVWDGGCAIVSRHDLRSIPMTLDRAIAGLVTLANGQVAVISAHFKCCGHAGSSEDHLRVQQAEQIIDEIKRMRDGAFGDQLKEVPVILIGDYNLVGSRTPLDLINKAGLNELLLRSPNDGSAYTWRGLNPDEQFWPGRLDLLNYNRLNPLSGFIIDTQRMSSKELLELRADDSLASDHLMLIGDFTFSEPQNGSRYP